MSATRFLAIATSTKPVVPDGPETVKLSSLLVELKANADSVEFEDTEKTYWSLNDVTERVLNISGDAKVALPAEALTMYVPVADGIQTAK